ncbi:hypothetical protein PAXRUDRAFT_823951 [Paxillus rubicundulus Ve08.2h10]|uniref:SET domain-containing protein n=1 Tax=Paxillus rubicundulus Ve08.2h10 TaxID=930991 RepID=A0A0D0E2S4_9AGAM|nr:hypothetical protein PAXRUDRAFT_823951 [Paxillus rubicundulus Ve08.2h10]
MNMRDLSRDDDFLSHLLVEKLGTGNVPLCVHKMDSSRRLPKVPASDLLAVVRRLVESKNAPQNGVRQAVDELLLLQPVRHYLKPYTQKQINAFATHASRYFELYHPGGCIEIAHTSRYSHKTGKSELCILATRPLTPGMVIAELKGSMAHLSKEEDRELKRTDLKNLDIRRDFSVIHSRQMKKNHLFLGPARFVNHDCENNCELFREGKYITFRVVRPIAIGEEITAHYGDGYFGSRNRYCLCETCEKNGRGGYGLEVEPAGCESDAGASDDDLSDSGPASSAVGNVNERRTRRGVYAIVQEQDDDSDESDDEEKEANKPLANASDVGEFDLELGGESMSSVIPSTFRRSASSSSIPPASLDSELSGRTKASFKSIISTRRQKMSGSASATPEVSTKSFTPVPSNPVHLPSHSARASASRPSTPINNNKGKEKECVPIKEEPEARILRTRPSLRVDRDESLGLAKHFTPIGPDGQPLPSCVTCHNVLPMISVDNKVVWGLNIDTTPRRGRKHKESQKCPRCMRHFAIYAQQWPARLASQAGGPVTRDEPETTSRRPAQKSLPAVEQKHASGGEERPAKRRKTEQAPVVEMSAKAKELLMPPKRKRGRPRKYPLPEEEPPKRKRGRPRKTSPSRQLHPSSNPKPQVPTPLVKIAIPRMSSPARSRHDSASPSSSRGHLKPKSLAVQLQPRDSNGRFGKKANTNGRFVRKKANTIRSSATRTQRALQRTKVKRWLADKQVEQEHVQAGDAGKDSAPLANGKRKTSIAPDDSPRPSKKLRSGLHLGDGDEDPVPPNPSGSSSSRFKGINGSLLCRPNPTNFARRTWAPPFGEDSSPEDEDAESSLRTLESESNGPVTPEDRTPLPILGAVQFPFKEKPIDIKHEDVAPHRSIPRPLTHGISTILTFRPSPVNFARRRWSSTIKSPLELGFENRRSQRLRLRSSLPNDNNLSLAAPHSHVPSTLSTRSILAGRSVSPQKSTEGNPGPRAVSEGASENLEDISACTSRRRTAFPGEESFDSTNSDDDRAVEGLLAQTPESHEVSANEDPLSHLRVTYTAELPAVVPWKNAQATPMSHYLKKSASFRGDELASPTHLVHAGSPSV